MDEVVEPKPEPVLVTDGWRWRVAFAVGFLDADAGRDPISKFLPYRAGRRAAEFRRRLLAKAA